MARVLLVDDDIAEISAVKRVLARAGHQPVLATNAGDAVAALAQTAPAIVLVGASCQNGDAVRELGDAQAARGIPMLVLGETGSSPEGAMQIPRPVDPDQLASEVASALAGAASSAGAAAPARAGGTPPAAPPALGGMSAPGRTAARGGTSAGAARRAPGGAAAARSNGASGEVASRKAAAEALRARAEELRRGGTPAQAAPQQLDPELDAALAELASHVPGAGIDLDPELDPGLEAILRRAEEAERAHAAEKKARARQADRAAVEAQQRAEAEQVAIEKAARARAAEARAQAEERARAEAEQLAAEKAARARAAEARAQAEERARAEAERRALEDAEARARAEAERCRVEEEARRRAAAEARRAEEAKRRAEEEKRRAEEEARRAADEGRRAEEEKRRAEEEKRRAAKARERARAEREARVDLEGELDRLRRQAEEEARRREADEEELRAAIASARAEMEALRRRGEEEARRRADAEAEVARLAREAERKAAEAAAHPAPFDFPVYDPGDDPPHDPAQESARRRVAALRERLPAAAPRKPFEAPPAAAPARSTGVSRPPPVELRSGTLADLPAPRLLALTARAEASGRIDFEGDGSRCVYLESGRIVGATSADPSDRVEELALRLGLVTRDQYRLVAGTAAPLATRRAAVALVERGFLKPSELTGLVRRRTEEVVFGVFGDPGARFRWSAAEVPPDERTALERTTLQLAVEGVRRRWLAPQVDTVLGGDATLLAPVSPGPTPVELGLSPDEIRALALADGLRTLDEIVAASPLDPLSARQALAALVLVGALAVRTFQGARPAAAATAAIDLARVRDKLDQVRRADYFTILGVGRLCTPHEVREACDRLRAEFDPARFQGVREDELDVRLDEIRRVVADARDVLADDRLRDEYLRGLGE